MKKIVSHKVTFYRSIFNGRNFNREWRWRIVANNGKILAASSESFINKLDCEYNAKSTAASINKFFREERKTAK